MGVLKRPHLFEFLERSSSDEKKKKKTYALTSNVTRGHAGAKYKGRHMARRKLRSTSFFNFLLCAIDDNLRLVIPSISMVREGIEAVLMWILVTRMDDVIELLL